MPREFDGPSFSRPAFSLAPRISWSSTSSTEKPASILLILSQWRYFSTSWYDEITDQLLAVLKFVKKNLQKLVVFTTLCSYYISPY